MVNNNILCFSDIHIYAHKGRTERLQHCLDTLFWVFQTARDRDIKNVICAGDLFQDRHKISVYAYHQTYKIFEQFSDLHIWLLLGNHDLWHYDKTDISSVIPIGALSHVTVIDKPSTHTINGLDIDFLPFTHDPITVISENFLKKSSVLIGHIAVDGAILNFHHKTKAEVSVEIDKDMVTVNRELFDGWKRVLLGHYHGAQKLTDKVEYIGSTLQLTFNEAFQKKHIISLNTETLEKEYIENDFSPKHYILTLNELSGVDLKGDFVRVYDDLSQTDVMEERAKIAERCPEAQISFHQEKTNEKEDKDRIQKFNLTEGDTLERFMAAEGTGELDREKLLTIGKGLCLEN